MKIKSLLTLLIVIGYTIPACAMDEIPDADLNRAFDAGMRAHRAHVDRSFVRGVALLNEQAPAPDLAIRTVNDVIAVGRESLAEAQYAPAQAQAAAPAQAQVPAQAADQAQEAYKYVAQMRGMIKSILPSVPKSPTKRHVHAVKTAQDAINATRKTIKHNSPARLQSHPRPYHPDTDPMKAFRLMHHLTSQIAQTGAVPTAQTMELRSSMENVTNLYGASSHKEALRAAQIFAAAKRHNGQRTLDSFLRPLPKNNDNGNGDNDGDGDNDGNGAQ